MALPSWSWMKNAACRGLDLRLFFGGDGERQSEKTARELTAKSICVGCPVRRSCLDFSLANGDKAGIWGGLDEDERASERRRRQRRASTAGVPVA